MESKITHLLPNFQQPHLLQNRGWDTAEKLREETTCAGQVLGEEVGERGFSFLALLLSPGQCSRPCVEQAGKAPASYFPKAKKPFWIRARLDQQSS